MNKFMFVFYDCEILFSSTVLVYMQEKLCSNPFDALAELKIFVLNLLSVWKGHGYY